MLPDDPAELTAGKSYGSEGIAQRYLCALLINGPAYGYHKSWPLSDRGTRFVAELYSQAFGPVPAGTPTFWNEMNLLAIDAEDKHAVDYAFVWPQVQFLVELKTLGGSHRPGQLSEYLLRARHHSPESAIDLLYLTQPMAAAAPEPMPERCRYAHIDWALALKIAEAVWSGSGDPREVRCLGLLRQHLEAEGALVAPGVVTSSRSAILLDDISGEWRGVLNGALVSAARVAAGNREAVQVPMGLADDEAFEGHLRNVKHLLEARIAESPELNGVKVWWWRSGTSSHAYTDAGALAGVELRLSPPKLP